MIWIYRTLFEYVNVHFQCLICNGENENEEILKQERILGKFKMLSQWILAHSQENYNI